MLSTLFQKTIHITAQSHPGYVSYIRVDTNQEITRSQSGVYDWAKQNNVKVVLDTKAQSCTPYPSEE